MALEPLPNNTKRLDKDAVNSYGTNTLQPTTSTPLSTPPKINPIAPNYVSPDANADGLARHGVAFDRLCSGFKSGTAVAREADIPALPPLSYFESSLQTSQGTQAVAKSVSRSSGIASSRTPITIKV